MLCDEFKISVVDLKLQTVYWLKLIIGYCQILHPILLKIFCVIFCYAGIQAFLLVSIVRGTDRSKFRHSVN